MLMTFIAGIVSVLFALLILKYSNSENHGEDLKADPLPPAPPPTLEPGEIPNDKPPIEENPLPKPIDWENLSCDEIEFQIEEIKNLLMTSKWSDPRIYPFWVEQLEIGEKVWTTNCSQIVN